MPLHGAACSCARPPPAALRELRSSPGSHASHRLLRPLPACPLSHARRCLAADAAQRAQAHCPPLLCVHNARPLRLLSARAQVFDGFLHSFTTYRSLLTRIKGEYDRALDDALKSVFDHVHMQAELAASQEAMVRGVRARAPACVARVRSVHIVFAHVHTRTHALNTHTSIHTLHARARTRRRPPSATPSRAPWRTRRARARRSRCACVRWCLWYTVGPLYSNYDAAFCFSCLLTLACITPIPTQDELDQQAALAAEAEAAYEAACAETAEIKASIVRLKKERAELELTVGHARRQLLAASSFGPKEKPVSKGATTAAAKK